MPHAPVIDPAGLGPGLPGLDLWDFWPVQTPDGQVARFGGDELWMALSAGVQPDPLARHALARIRLLRRSGERWDDLGDLLPDAFSPGSREWSGSAIVEGDRLTLFFTAAGHRGERAPTYEQRLFETSARLDGTRLTGWSPPVQSVASDRHVYHPADQVEGEVGTIKAFRDPAFFRDPAGSGGDYLLFAASLGPSRSAFNGAVGLARRDGTGWSLLPPLVEADHVNNELERPHAVVHQGRYYLFWSTQSQVFAPGLVAPTGLYGMVADRFLGPYRPLNSTGLVLANPPQQPRQAYSWLVTSGLEVISFADVLPGHPTRPLWQAPPLALVLDGATAALDRPL